MKIAKDELSINTDKPDNIQVESNVFFRKHSLEALKPFVSLEILSAHDLHNAGTISSGTAVITYVLAGEALFSDSTGNSDTLKQEDWSWVISGNGIRNSIEPLTPNFKCIQVGIALSPALENSSPQSRYVRIGTAPFHKQVRILIGWYEQDRSQFAFPAGANYLAVHLKSGDSWSYDLPLNHKFSWAFVVSGQVKTNSRKHNPGELIYTARGDDKLSVRASEDSVLVVGSAIEFGYDLVFHESSVHTSPESLRNALAAYTRT